MISALATVGVLFKQLSLKSCGAFGRNTEKCHMSEAMNVILKLGCFDWNTETHPTSLFFLAVLFSGVARRELSALLCCKITTL